MGERIGEKDGMEGETGGERKGREGLGREEGHD
jgi:hypothetical protein